MIRVLCEIRALVGYVFVGPDRLHLIEMRFDVIEQQI
jgi:hypothetical protein